jgi:hypothetical protein
MLFLLWESLNDIPVAQWTPEEVNELGAVNILEVAQDHCDDRERPGSYAAVWTSAEGVQLARKSFNCKPDEDDEDEEEGSVGEAVKGRVRTEDSSPQGQVAQMMRHVEVDRRITNAANAAAFAALQQVVKDLRSELALEKQENRNLRSENRRLRRESEEDNPAEASEALARAEVWTEVGQAIKTVAQHAAPAVASKFVEQVANASKPNGKSKRAAPAEEPAES